LNLKFVEPQIIFQDRHILVINKPSGMVVNRSETAKGLTVQEWVEDYLGWDEGNTETLSLTDTGKTEFLKRSGVVHRLDKDTSGVMVLAKNTEVFFDLKNQFKTRKVKKEYIALAHGKVSPKKGNINLPITRNPKNRMRFTVKASGRRALTFYEVERHYGRVRHPANVFSFLRVRPKTGRTHQIRVHFTFLGHPIVSDPLYLSKKKRLREDLKWCPRLFLHARRLAFRHPGTKKKVRFEVKLPEDLSAVLSYFGKVRPGIL